MYIAHAKISNYRALQTISIPLNQFSVLIGENDVGKTSFLYALEAFFQNKKISDEDDYYKSETDKIITIELTFREAPDLEELNNLKNSSGDIIIKKSFSFSEKPTSVAVQDDDSTTMITAAILSKYFSSDNFHFIPVRRDLSVQFTMGKQALLGKTLRAKMKDAMQKNESDGSLDRVKEILTNAIKEPEKALDIYLKEQMHNDHIKLFFDELEVDPIEGVSFKAKLSDDRVDNILIHNRGAGTQNNLIIALFRFIASLHVDSNIIFAMEEPENSLHPKAQRQLLSVLQDISNESQVIVTTHSPVFIERSKFENNIILTRTVKGNTVAKTFDKSQLEQLRIDLGIRPSDALLKGGGNCAILVEGNCEEEGFPIFMEMLGLSEFQLGISIINMRGSDYHKVSNIIRLLGAYDIPCVVVLDNDAKKTEDDLKRSNELLNLIEIFRLKKGAIEDYYPLNIVADVINSVWKPDDPIKESEFDSTKNGKEKVKNFTKVMFGHGLGEPEGYLKRMLGLEGAKLMKDRKMELDAELEEIFKRVQSVVESQ